MNLTSNEHSVSDVGVHSSQHYDVGSQVGMMCVWGLFLYEQNSTQAEAGLQTSVGYLHLPTSSRSPL